MAKKKISGLPAGNALNGTELVPIVQTGTTKRITTQDIANLGNSSGVEGSGTINYLAKFTASSTIGNSQLFDDGTSVGIGTATPGDKLDIYSSANSQQGLKITNPNAGTSAIAVTKYSNGTYTHLFGILGTNYTTYGVLQANEAFMYSAAQSMSFGADGDSSIKFGTGTGVVERMRITSAGNVGIGTTSPARTLSVNGQIGLSDDLISSNGVNILRLGYAAYYASSAFNLVTENSIPLTFGTASTEKMRLFANGNFAINTTTDAGYKLDVNGTARVSGILLASAGLNNTGVASNTWATSSSEGLALKGSASNNAISTITTYLDDTAITIGAGVSNKTGITINGQTSGSGSSFLVRTGGATRLTIASTGVATFANAIAIGNSVASAVAAPSTHKVTIVIGGVTYYLLASNV